MNDEDTGKAARLAPLAPLAPAALTARRSPRRTVPARLLAVAIPALTALAAWLPNTAVAQDFPSRPITIVMPFAPGGPDRIARLVADKMAASMKQPVVLDYKPGATGLIGAGIVQKAKPDGYTLLFSSNSGMVVAPMLRQPAPFDPLKDFAPVSIVMRYPMFLDVPPNHPARSVAEFVALAKAKPNSVSFGSPGIGSVGHLTTEMFARQAAITLTHVPYKGIGEAQNGVMAGDIQLFLDGPLSSAELVKAGKIRALAVTGSKRLAAFPDVPSMKEAGYPGVAALVWIGFFAPKETPEPVVRRLADEIARAVRADDVREQIAQGGLAEPVGGTPAEMADAIRAETPEFARIVKELNLRVQ